MFLAYTRARMELYKTNFKQVLFLQSVITLTQAR